MSSFVDPDDGDMSQYMASLDRVLRLQPQVIHPGHGPMVENGTELIRKYIAHRLEREQQIIATARGRGPTAPMELVEVIYAAYPQALHPLAARSVQAHLDKLVREGRATRTAVNDEPRYAIP